jgi:hypothetical protein
METITGGARNCFSVLTTRVADPDPELDPDSIGSVDPDPQPWFGIRIRIQEVKNDPKK